MIINRFLIMIFKMFLFMNFLYYLVLIFAGMDCSYGSVQENVDKDSDLILISKFLEIQSEQCGHVQLCTIKGRSNVNFTYKEQPCCRSCSCDELCIDTGNCCPDFWLRDIIGDAKFETITDFLNFTQQKDLPQKKKTSDAFIDTEQIGDVISCISSRMKTRNLKYGFKDADEGYVMISLCPLSYTNAEIKSRCEDNVIQTTTSENKFIPVTSVDTKRTYRNKFCLSCHEGIGKEFVPWKSWLTCSHREVAQQFLERPNKLFQSVALGYTTFCNIMYKPSTDVQSAAYVCKQADVTSCPNISDSDKGTSSNVTNLYEQICRLYYLPVFVTEKRALKYTIYKNIACYLCNTDESLSKVCINSYPQYEEYQLEINVMDVTSNEIKQLRHAQSSLGIRYDVSCNVGYIFDETLSICRKVLCPQHFYIYEGSCVPVIANMKGIYFEIMLEVKPRVLITTTNRFHEQYEEALDIVLTREVKTIFSEMHTDMWRKTKNYMLHSNIVRLKFRNEDDTYSETMEKIQKLLNHISYLRDVSLNLTANVNLANNVFEQRRGQNIFDRGTGFEFNPIRVSTEIYRTKAEYVISKAHLCYRLELNDSEISWTGKYGFKVIRTGFRVEGVNFDWSDKGYLACIDDVIVKTVINVGNSIVANTVVEGTSHLILFMIFGAFIAFAICLVAGRFIFSCIHGQRTE